MNRRRFLLIAACAGLSRPARAEITTWRADMFGGTVCVELRGPRNLAAHVADCIATTIREVEMAASLFNPSSALNRLNAAGRLDDPPPALSDLLRLADTVHTATGGRFDASIQPLWRARAEGGDMAAARRAIGWNRVEIGPPTRLARGQALTFNGIAQGYAADRVRRLLLAGGYVQALVDMGEFAALGGPFSVGVEDPSLGRIAVRRLIGNAIATSSPTAMRLGDAFHILGPHDERPQWSTIAVEAESAALADGFSTAFCLMSPTEIRTARSGTASITRVTAVDLAGDVWTF